MTLTLSELARLIDGTIITGEFSTQYTGMAALDAAQPSDISFLGNAKYLPLFNDTKAGAVIVPRSVHSGPEHTALIAVDNPSMAFAAVVQHFAPPKKVFTPGIHPTAWVDPTATLNPDAVAIHPGAVISAHATIGDGTEIGANVVIGEHARIGHNCLLHPNSTVRERCILGDRVILQPGAVIGSDGYGYEFIDGRHVKIDQIGIVELADDVEIGANTTIDRARFGKTYIGEGTKIDNLVQIAHNVTTGKHCLIISQTGIAGSSHLGNHVTAAAQVGIIGHLSVGDGAILGARTGVTTSLKGGITYLGNPALPFSEEQKIRALTRKLPSILEDIKTLKKSSKA